MVKNPPANAGDARDAGFNPWVGRTPWRRKRQPTPVFLPGDSHGQRGLAGCSLGGHKQLGTTEATQHAHVQEELLGHKETLFLIFEDCPYCFPRGQHSEDARQRCKGFQSPHILSSNC